MKRIFMALAVLLTIQIADAQVKTPADAKKAVEAAVAATENPKKAAKPATWLKLGNAYMDAYTAPMGNGWIGANKQELTFIMGNVKPTSTQNVTLAGETYSKETYKTMNYYFNAGQQLAIIEVTKPVYEDALDQALKAYLEAEKVDAKGSKTKDIDAGIKNVAAKYMEKGLNDYMFGNYKGAAENFEKSVDAGAEAPNPVIDTMTIYNAGFTALMAEDLSKAEVFFRKCIELGYAAPLPEGLSHFGPYQFVLDDKNFVETKPDPIDEERILNEIREAKRQADVVLFSLHTHEMNGKNFFSIPQFVTTMTHEAIDAGASVVIGHGPHMLRGVEVYNGGVILHSLGNFIFQTETIAAQPYDAFVKMRLSQDTRVGEYMNNRSKNDTVGYPAMPDIWRAFAAGWTLEDGRITEMKLYPIELGMHASRAQRGWPRLSRSMETLEKIRELSAELNTKVEIRDGVGHVTL